MPISTPTKMMRRKTNKMLVIASRGPRRAGYVPTKRTKPALLSRRYSIDVITKNWDDFRRGGWNEDDLMEGATKKPIYHETDPVAQRKSTINLPDPLRYAGFGPMWATLPPYNNEIYLDLDGTIISNNDFLAIGATAHDSNLSAWMRDDSINMALELLRRDQNCDAYSIDIANSNSAQVFYAAAIMSDGSTQGYDEYRARFRGKRWIFIVINDAFGGVENDGTTGTHWSLVGINRARKTCHYYDSLSMNNRGIGETVATGLLQILGEDLYSWTFHPEYYSPNQHEHNQFKYDVGACGPFVYTITRMLINWIKNFQDDDKEWNCILSLGRDFGEYFETQFNSQLVRWEIQYAMIRWKCGIDAARLIHDHDQAAVRDEETTLTTELPAVFEIPISVHTHASSGESHDTHHRDTLEPDSDGSAFQLSDSELSETASDSTEDIQLDPPDLPMDDVDTDIDVEQHEEPHGESREEPREEPREESREEPHEEPHREQQPEPQQEPHQEEHQEHHQKENQEQPRKDHQEQQEETSSVHDADAEVWDKFLSSMAESKTPDASDDEDDSPPAVARIA